MPTKLDPKVKAMLPSIYTREQLEYAKGCLLYTSDAADE